MNDSKKKHNDFLHMENCSCEIKLLTVYIQLYIYNYYS